MATNSATSSIAIYSFNSGTGVISASPVLTRNYTTGYGTSVAWSPDGNYLAATGLASSSGVMNVYAFNLVVPTLGQVSTLPFGTSARVVNVPAATSSSR